MLNISKIQISQNWSGSITLYILKTVILWQLESQQQFEYHFISIINNNLRVVIIIFTFMWSCLAKTPFNIFRELEKKAFYWPLDLLTVSCRIMTSMIVPLLIWLHGQKIWRDLTGLPNPVAILHAPAGIWTRDRRLERAKCLTGLHHRSESKQTELWSSYKTYAKCDLIHNF